MAPDRGIEMVGGDLGLNFANTMGWHAREQPVEHLETYGDFVHWTRRADVVSSAQAAELLRRGAAAPGDAARALRRARHLRETIYRVFSRIAGGHKPPDRELAGLLRLVARAMASGIPAWRQGKLHLVWSTDDALDWPVHPIAFAAGDLLSSPRRERVRQCGNDPCGWLFIDTTRNRSRRWCTSAECGNVTRVRRFRAKKA
ncbi:MAG TPA: ABATE domain-containing protein [Gemmatimonadales bacterium]|nr:ABATE domain-containing protein [Gemmatimonadales bacterium]